MSENERGETWSETDSDAFIEYGRYFVPERETQIETICDVIPPAEGAIHLVELCCGEGLLSHALLERFPAATVHAFDGSPAMLQRARETNAAFGDRFDAREFHLAAPDWRAFPWPVHAVVSSLAVHHLDGPGKLRLFTDVTEALIPGGVLVIADLVEPTTAAGRTVAAKAWDEAVRQSSLALDGTLKAFEHFRDDDWNYYTAAEPDPVDMPSPLFSQLAWLEEAGLRDADVHWLKAGHAIFSARKPAA